ncbi:MAG: hypothetical protein EBS61_13855, partial [Betaproteobacteria bacterium]|nr:hypothetical protein [Betaproteobacteria bacterium]
AVEAIAAMTRKRIVDLKPVLCGFLNFSERHFKKIPAHGLGPKRRPSKIHADNLTHTDVKLP